MKIIIIEVPRVRRQLKPVYINGNPKTGTYRRDYSGNYLCDSDELAAMYRDAADNDLDSIVLDGMDMNALCNESVRSYRRSYDLHHDRSAWSKLDDGDFLVTRSAFQAMRSYQKTVRFDVWHLASGVCSHIANSP